MIAALYVEHGGVYFGIEGVEPWAFPEKDARDYSGPYAVVAHPPCNRWSRMGALNFARWGGEHNRPGNDGGCFKAALDCVNTYGGVLEHPAGSAAFATFGLRRPHKVGCGWGRSGDGWVCEVWQSAYGHRANKATWLYYRGVKQPWGGFGTPFDLVYETPRGTHQIGFQDRRGKNRNKPTLSKGEASRTPVSFRDVLIQLAEHSQHKFWEEA